MEHYQCPSISPGPSRSSPPLLTPRVTFACSSSDGILQREPSGSGFCHPAMSSGEPSFLPRLTVAYSTSLLGDTVSTTTYLPSSVADGHSSVFRFGVLIYGALTSILIDGVWGLPACISVWHRPGVVGWVHVQL